MKSARAYSNKALEPLGSSALLVRVTDKNKLMQFASLLRTRFRVTGSESKQYRLLDTWSRDGCNSSFHRYCGNQGPSLLLHYIGHRALHLWAHHCRHRICSSSLWRTTRCGQSLDGCSCRSHPHHFPHPVFLIPCSSKFRPRS